MAADGDPANFLDNLVQEIREKMYRARSLKSMRDKSETQWQCSDSGAKAQSLRLGAKIFDLKIFGV